MALRQFYVRLVSGRGVGEILGNISEISRWRDPESSPPRLMRPYKWAPTAYRHLNGVFCVYKPTGLSSRHVLDTIKERLLRDLNALPCYQHEVRVQSGFGFGPASASTSATSVAGVPATTTVPSLQTDYSAHRLVLGQRYIKDDIRANYIHGVPKHGSGVMVLGIGKRGKEYVELLSYAKYLRVYHIKGRLGYCTDDSMASGKFVQRTTFRHLTKVKLDKMCGAMQSGHQKLMFDYAGVDPSSQEAYELASRGIVRPVDGNTPPLLYGVKCIDFNSPDFTLEVHSINETGQYLADLVHNIGLKLKSSAVCTHIHRLRYGHFELRHALLRDYWNLESIVANIRWCERLMKPANLLTADVISREEGKQGMKNMESVRYVGSAGQDGERHGARTDLDRNCENSEQEFRLRHGATEGSEMQGTKVGSEWQGSVLQGTKEGSDWQGSELQGTRKGQDEQWERERSGTPKDPSIDDGELGAEDILRSIRAARKNRT